MAAGVVVDPSPLTTLLRIRVVLSPPMEMKSDSTCICGRQTPLPFQAVGGQVGAAEGGHIGSHAGSQAGSHAG